jgi:dipeptidyl aminopeptidase/acylaminoacyl peptidase
MPVAARQLPVFALAKPDFCQRFGACSMPPVPPSLRESEFVLDGDRAFTVERFAPERLGPAASVVLLHGADGLKYRGPTYRAMARHLATRGMRVDLPHYFERSGTSGRASFSRPLDFLGWMEAVDEVLEAAGPGPTGLVGVSLGGYLSLAVAGRDERAGAVVVVCGGMPAILTSGFSRMPPVLILHGNDDRVVPPSEARTLADWLKGRGTPHELVMYPEEGHHFTDVASADALRRTTWFLQQHLHAD